MELYTAHDDHRFCWADLRTTDTVAAQHFYGNLFGWTFETLDMPDRGFKYILNKLDGHKVAGMTTVPPEQLEADVSAAWNSCVCVKDLRASRARCLELGAEVILDDMNIRDLGSMTVIREPQGASFSLWQPRNLKGMEAMYQPGAACWFELVTNDVDASVQFYGSAFGWKAAMDSHEPAYTNLSRTEAAEEEDLVGGMMKIEPDWGGVFPNWAIYFQVDQVDASLAQLQKLGGEALHNPIDIPNERLITVRDPQGGVFALLESTTET